MGQYLSTGLVYAFSLSKEKAENNKISISDVEEMLEKKYLFSMELYDKSMDEHCYHWVMKESVFEKELPLLLTELLPRISSDKEDVLTVLENIKGRSAQEILAFADRKSCYCFRKDDYAEAMWLRFTEKNFRPSIPINTEMLSFSMEGKIIMESYGEQFRFFKHCIINTYPLLPIATGIRIYITG